VFKQSVTLTGRSTTRPPWSVNPPAARPAVLQTTTTDASKQNNTSPLGGPVISSHSTCSRLVF